MDPVRGAEGAGIAAAVAHPSSGSNVAVVSDTVQVATKSSRAVRGGYAREDATIEAMEATLEAPRAARTWVRITLILIPCLLFVGLLAYGLFAQGSAPGVGDEAPDFEAPLLGGGGNLALEDLEGKPVFLNFWGSWCEPCKDEAPALRRAERVYGDEVAFVGINIRDGIDDALAFADEHGLDYQHVRDEGLAIYEEYGLTGQPESFFIDRDGEVVEHVAGPVDEDGLVQVLDVLVRRGGG